MSKVIWHGDRVKLALHAALQAMVAAAAFEVEALAKVNITNNGQVDTGFMRQSVYASTPKGSTTPAASGVFYSTTEQRLVERTALPSSATPGDTSAIVAVAAEYGIYQEIAQPYLYPALERVASSYGGQIVAAGKGEVK